MLSSVLCRVESFTPLPPSGVGRHTSLTALHVQSDLGGCWPGGFGRFPAAESTACDETGHALRPPRLPYHCTVHWRQRKAAESGAVATTDRGVMLLAPGLEVIRVATSVTKHANDKWRVMFVPVCL